MAEQRRELLNDGEGEKLGDVIALSLSVPNTPRPGQARFTITWDRDITLEGPFDLGDVSQSDIKATAAQFMEDFIPLMGARGYRLKPFGADNLETLYSEEVDIPGKSLEQVARDFQEGIRTVKSAIAASRFGKGRGGQERT